MSYAQTQIDSIILAGGLDQITPTLSLKNGFARFANNFECSVTGGYSRIEGYERFDGHTSPTDAAASSDYQYLSFASFASTPAVGSTLTSSSGATGAIAYVTGLDIVITKITGTWAVGNTAAVGATQIGTVTSVSSAASTPLIDAQVKNGIADIYRASIAAVPGSGSILGVFALSGVTYAFRNIVAGTSAEMYKSTSSGWSKVTLGVTLSPSGRYEFVEYNFAGQAATTKVYGCDGVNKAFSFDGTTFTRITTGATVDTPTHVTAHKGRLYLAQGSSVQWSVAGAPTDFTGASGAGEYATGDTVTGIISMPGGTSSATLGVFSRNNTSILYGDPADPSFNAISFNTGTGAVAYSVANMAQTFAFDDRGLSGIQTALQYGNFNATTLTNAVLPFVTSKVNKFAASMLNRRKSQYRAFFTDGTGLYTTVVNGKLLGNMPVAFPNVVTCTYEGKSPTGADINLFGSTNGMVYQLDKGTSFDGEPIDFALELNYSNSGGPRTLKRYRRASLEVLSQSPSYVTLDFGYYLGYASDEYSQENYSQQQERYLGTSRWDSFVWDSFFWDTNSIEPLNAELDGTAENISIVITGSADYCAPWTINSILLHFTSRRMMR